MEVKQLRYFVAIAEERSLTAAAVRIGMAQPSLSQHVRNLEDMLGVKLLTRSPRGVTVTEQGELLLTRAREILGLIDRAQEEVRFSGGDPSGKVSFGLPSSVSMVMSVPLAETIRVVLPKIQLRVAEAMSGFIQSWLEDQTIDLAMLYNVSQVRHMHLRLLMTETLEFFAAADAWPLDQSPGVPIALSRIAGLDLVLPSKAHGLRSLIDHVARTCGIALDAVLEMDSLPQIKSLVARGSCYTILAPAAAQDMVDRGELVAAPIHEPVIRRPVYLVRNPVKLVTRASAEVERETMKVVNDLVSRRIWRGEIAREYDELQS